MSTKLTINGQTLSVDAALDTPLLWVVREQLQLTGTKYGCGIGMCGACTIHLDGAAVRSCVLPLAAAVGKSITTIEGLSSDSTHPVQQAWVEASVPQCGYCQSGMIMAASALLKQNKDPSDQDIADNITNICRCGTYPRITQAIKKAADIQDQTGTVDNNSEKMLA